MLLPFVYMWPPPPPPPPCASAVIFGGVKEVVISRSWVGGGTQRGRGALAWDEVHAADPRVPDGRVAPVGAINGLQPQASALHVERGGRGRDPVKADVFGLAMSVLTPDGAAGHVRVGLSGGFDPIQNGPPFISGTHNARAATAREDDAFTVSGGKKNRKFD